MERWIVILATLCCLAAVCTPQQAEDILSQGTSHVFDERQKVNFALVLDKSGSMRGDKLLQSKEAANKLISELSETDSATIISFDSEPFLNQRLTSSKPALERGINTIRVGDFTHYSPALRMALNQLPQEEKNVVILLSDGRPDDGQVQLFSQVQDLVSNNVCIFTIAYADSADAQAQETLSEIALLSQNSMGCGGYFYAQENTYELGAIFQEIYTIASSEKLLDVNVEVEVGSSSTIFRASTRSSLNRASLSNTCFTPQFDFTIIQNKQVLQEVTSSQEEVELQLPSGSYEYIVYAEETCGGSCLYTGSAKGHFNITQSSAACMSSWENISTQLRSQEHIEVHITDTGFSPQTVGSDGIITWRNLDTKPHQVVGMDGSFRSPILQQGEIWSSGFGGGTYTYTDPVNEFSGTFRNQQKANHYPVDLILILDRSGSMAGLPLENAKLAAENLLRIMEPNDRASLIIFSDQAKLLRSLTSDISSLQAGIAEMTSEGSTFYLDALNLAQRQIGQSSNSRESVVIFLSDGLPFDEGGDTAIIEQVRQLDTCIYTIGYGEQGEEAVSLLERMAKTSYEERNCGAFYRSTAEKDILSGVFGEIYAFTQTPGLEFFDTVIEETTGKVDISTRVRSSSNGQLIPSGGVLGCIPVAQVVLVFEDTSIPLLYENGKYRTSVSLPGGTYEGMLRARVSSPGDPARSAIGTEQVSLSISSYRWVWILMLSMVAVLTIVIYIRRH